MRINLAEYPQCIRGNILTGGGSVYTREIVRNGLLQTSAGVRVKFSTDSSRVAAAFEAETKPVPPHIGRALINAVSYAVWDGKAAKPVKIECISSRSNFETVYSQTACKNLQYEFFLPSFNKIDNLTVEIDDDATFFPAENMASEPLVFLGGPFTAGCGCTFATAMFSSIIARRLNRNHFNFAINTHKFLSCEIASQIASLNPVAVVAEAESVGMDYDYLREGLKPYLTAILKNTKCPVLLLTQPFWGDKSCRYEEKITHVKQVVKELSLGYPCRLMLIDGAKVFVGVDYDRYSFSLNFINDEGNALFAKYILPIVQSYIF